MRYLLVCLALLTLIGCTQTGEVRVVDDQGAPVPDARVEPVSLSMNGAHVKTDGQGHARVPLAVSGVQETVWVQVNEPSYAMQQLPVPARWPLIVVLQRDQTP